jgi:protein-tyrosine phosphatase
VFSFFFKKKPVERYIPVTTDIHSHLLAHLDDGVKSLDEAAVTVRSFQDLGYRKLITTPHIMSDYYRNTPATISGALADLQQFLLGKTDLQVEAAAEYYLDESLLQKMEGQEPLLTFGEKYLLFETNFISEPLRLKEFIFKATSSGFKLVLAHPERYAYMTIAKAEDLRDRGVLFQANALSFMGYYSKPVQRIANELVDKGWIDFLGSDCHSPEHAGLLALAHKTRYYQKALALPLLNHSL